MNFFKKNISFLYLRVSFFFPIFLLLPGENSFAAHSNQIPLLDSLRFLLAKYESQPISFANDTTRVKILNDLGWEMMYSHPDSSALLTTKALVISEKYNWKKGMAESLNLLGSLNRMKGLYNETLDQYIRALNLRKEINDQKGQAAVMGNIGNVFFEQGDYPKALDYYLRALQTEEKMEHKIGIANNESRIGAVYWSEKELEKAIEHLNKALKIYKEINDEKGISTTLGNIGNVYIARKEYDTSLVYYNMALAYREKMNDKFGIANMLGNIGSLYKEKSILAVTPSKRRELLDSALYFSKEALKINEEIENKQWLASNLANIGIAYRELKKFQLAEDYLKKAILISNDLGALDMTMQFEINLSDFYVVTGQFEKALDHFKLAIDAKDSIFNEEKNNEITRKELNYEFEKKESETKARHDKQIALGQAEKRKQQIIIWASAGGLLLIAVILIIVFRSLKITRKQKTLIEKQKALVEEKNLLVVEQKKQIEEQHKETIASITYAKRLQQAILPPLDMVKKYLPESFLIYLPKDIVAGDFYWISFQPSKESGNNANANLEEQEKGKIPPFRAGGALFIAACDCTGHGVPGAMVSVVCSNALNRAVKEFGLCNTGEILDKVTDLVLETFSASALWASSDREKSNSVVNDGMDISLLKIEFSSHPENKTVPHKEAGEIDLKPTGFQWSGANNPLWYFFGNKFFEITADKQPIGKTDVRRPFTTHKIDNFISGEEGEEYTFYLFTDGFPDQFGGPRGKKYKYRQLQENFNSIIALPLKEQEIKLRDFFNHWKGDLEQVDDVTIFGFRV